MRIAVLAAVVALAGCAGTGQLLRDGAAYPFTFNAATKTMTTTIDGDTYSGSYILNSGVGTASGFAGGRFATMTVVGSATQGRSMLTSPSGKVLRCEFAVQGMSAIGQCQDSQNRMYDLVTQ